MIHIKHLKNYDSIYSVKNLLKNDKTLIDLYFAKPEEMVDLKYIKIADNYKSNNFDLNFEEYPTIKKEKFLS